MSWALPKPVLGGELCAVLHPHPDAAARVALAINPADQASSTGIGSGRHEVVVAPSGGAFVLAGASDSAVDGSPYVIDPKGQKYALLGAEVPGYIGYSDVDPVLVISTLMPGVALSTNAARRVPEDAPPPSEGEATSS